MHVQNVEIRLVDSRGYYYTVKEAYKNSTTWRCSIGNKKVSCMATVRETKESFIKCVIAHCHAPNVGLLPACQVKAAVQKEMFLSLEKEEKLKGLCDYIAQMWINSKKWAPHC
jgi:hypothetical protein